MTLQGVSVQVFAAAERRSGLTKSGQAMPQPTRKNTANTKQAIFRPAFGEVFDELNDDFLERPEESLLRASADRKPNHGETDAEKRQRKQQHQRILEDAAAFEDGAGCGRRDRPTRRCRRPQPTEVRGACAPPWCSRRRRSLRGGSALRGGWCRRWCSGSAPRSRTANFSSDLSMATSHDSNSHGA